MCLKFMCLFLPEFQGALWEGALWNFPAARAVQEKAGIDNPSPRLGLLRNKMLHASFVSTRFAESVAKFPVIFNQEK